MKSEPFPPFLTDLILYCVSNLERYKPKNIGLVDNELANTIYESKRSKFKYIYLRTPTVMLLNYIILAYLYFKTGKLFNNTVNKKCMPINIYLKGDIIKLHKDRDMFNPSTPVTDILTITLYQTGVSYFYLIDNVKSSEDGKEIEVLPESIENVYKTKQSSYLMFNNTNSAHELECMSGARISLTYRR